MPPEWANRAAQVLPTEHFTLQSARSATISDSSSRASLYLSSVSISLVAYSFIGQASALGTAFDVFGLVLFLTLFVLGLATFYRLTQSSVEDFLYARGINRIRHFYLEFVPEAERYFILSAHDDSLGVMRNMALAPSRWQLFLTTAGTIGIINSVVAVSLAVGLAEPPLAVAVAVGAGAFGETLPPVLLVGLLVAALGGMVGRKVLRTVAPAADRASATNAGRAGPAAPEDASPGLGQT